MPVLVAGFVLCCWCQLPAWSVAAGASCRLGLLVAVPAAGLVCCSTCQLPAW
ncbi:hypothetical protein PR001_g31431 [Phytophthora rubi]|uniref:Uncharacterized protein n=1 Tax=Phytophthora rubi TaxID=129364 RepID=A0A6A3GLT2_9STRA|nr:hypothetical protein PR001_g31431 [Phytophthora rubi]